MLLARRRVARDARRLDQERPQRAGADADRRLRRGARPRLETGTKTAFSIQSASANVKHLSLIGLHLVASCGRPAHPTSRRAATMRTGCGSSRGSTTCSSKTASSRPTPTTSCSRTTTGRPATSRSAAARSSMPTHRRRALAGAIRLRRQRAAARGQPVRPQRLERDHSRRSGDDLQPQRLPLVQQRQRHRPRQRDRQRLQPRAAGAVGGRIENNLFLDNPIGLTFGVVTRRSVTPGGVSGVVNGNVFLGTRDIAGAGRGNGMEIGNTRPNIPTVVSNNIFADANPAAGKDYAMVLSYAGDSSTNGELAAGLNDLTVQGNIVYKWTKGLRFDAQFAAGAAGVWAQPRHHSRQRHPAGAQRAAGGARVADRSAQEKWAANRYDAGPGARLAVFPGRQTMTPEKWVSSHDAASGVAACGVCRAGSHRRHLRRSGRHGALARGAADGDAQQFLAALAPAVHRAGGDRLRAGGICRTRGRAAATGGPRLRPSPSPPPPRRPRPATPSSPSQSPTATTRRWT